MLPLLLSLDDRQMKFIMTFSSSIEPEKRSEFLERVSAMLTLRGRFDDADLAEAARRAATGLVRSSAA